MARRRRGSSGAPGIDAGARQTRVTIQKLVGDHEGAGESGFPVPDWADLVAVDMSQAEVGGLERFAVSQTSAPYETRWGMEYRPDMDPDLLDIPKVRRLVVGARVHDIVDASVVGRLDGIELLTLSRRG